MTRDELLRFIDEDKVDESYFSRHHHELSIEDRFEIAEELFRRGLARDPDLLSEERRREDLAHHTYVANALRRVPKSSESPGESGQ